MRSKHETTELLPQGWLELLAQLDGLTTDAPPTQPEPGEDGHASRGPEPASLVKQLARLEMRARAEVERERWCAAVDRAVAELVSTGRMTPRSKEP
jgi:hypothetical protein